MRLCLSKYPGTYASPEEWVAGLQTHGLSAAGCPVDETAGARLVQEYRQAAQENDIVIAEVGAWSNPISENPQEREAAFRRCVMRLALADAIGARCCVNIAGSKSAKWDGPHADNFSQRVFEEIVACVRRIIAEAGPKRAVYSLEPMPFMPPDSAHSYLQLIAAVNSPRFGVHFDPVNIVSSPRLYYENGAMIEEFVGLLGPRIASCHLKDIALGEGLTVHLSEVPPGEGGLDMAAYLRCLAALPPDLPLMIEHLQTDGQYEKAARHVRAVAHNAGVAIR